MRVCGMSNSHILQFLKYYIEFPEAPRYAVLVKGPWGVGKTSAIKTMIDDFRSPDRSIVYVSLNGLASEASLDAALVRATYWYIDNKAAKLTGRIAQAAMKFAKVEIKLDDLVNRTDAEVIVFDDLERVNMDIKSVLGYINEFVEHENRKVIILAAEDEISKELPYAKIKEKVIGRSFDFESQTADIFPHLAERMISREAKEFVISKTGVILRLCEQASISNLRIIQQSLWDFERIYDQIDNIKRKNDAAIILVMQLIFALSFELRSDRINEEELLQRSSLFARSVSRVLGKDKAKTKLDLAQDRYKDIDLCDPILSDNTLYDILHRGYADPVAINQDLDQSKFFITLADEPPWRTVWYAYERTQAELDNALPKVNASFEQREFVKMGEAMHVFGLRLFHSRIGVNQKSSTETLAECITYIDDLYTSKKIEPAPLESSLSLISMQGYGGLGFQEGDSAEMRQLFEYFAQRRRAARVDTYADVAKELMDVMAQDVDDFNKLVSFDNGIGGKYISLPVLSLIDAKAFVKQMFSLHPKSQRSIMTSLYVRYDGDRLNRDLSAEKPWIVKVKAEMLQQAEELHPIHRARVANDIAIHIDRYL